MMVVFFFVVCLCTAGVARDFPCLVVREVCVGRNYNNIEMSCAVSVVLIK